MHRVPLACELGEPLPEALQAALATTHKRVREHLGGALDSGPELPRLRAGEAHHRVELRLRQPDVGGGGATRYAHRGRLIREAAGRCGGLVEVEPEPRAHLLERLLLGGERRHAVDRRVDHPGERGEAGVNLVEGVGRAPERVEGLREPRRADRAPLCRRADAVGGFGHALQSGRRSRCAGGVDRDVEAVIHEEP